MESDNIATKEVICGMRELLLELSRGKCVDGFKNGKRKKIQAVKKIKMSTSEESRREIVIFSNFSEMKEYFVH